MLLIADILISNSFNHYVNLDIMLSLGIPCVVAICAVHYCMQRLYAMDTGVCPVTISIGVTRYNGRDNYQLAVQCADKALYQAKK